jgi:allophanate hydrolase subunit 1
MFDPHRGQPTLLSAGDSVRFVPVDAGEFEAIAKNAGDGR